MTNKYQNQKYENRSYQRNGSRGPNNNRYGSQRREWNGYDRGPKVHRTQQRQDQIRIEIEETSPFTNMQAPSYGELPQDSGQVHQTYPKIPQHFENISLVNHNSEDEKNEKFDKEFLDISKDKTIGTVEKVRRVQKSIVNRHKYQIIGFCAQSSKNQLVRLGLIEKSFRQTQFPMVIDSANIKKSLNDIFKESQLERNPQRYQKFLVFLEKVIISSQKPKGDTRFKYEIVEALNLQKLNPEIQNAEWKSAREKIRQIVEKAMWNQEVLPEEEIQKASVEQQLLGQFGDFERRKPREYQLRLPEPTEKVEEPKEVPVQSSLGPKIDQIKSWDDQEMESKEQSLKNYLNQNKSSRFSLTQNQTELCSQRSDNPFHQKSVGNKRSLNEIEAGDYMDDLIETQDNKKQKITQSKAKEIKKVMAPLNKAPIIRAEMSLDTAQKSLQMGQQERISEAPPNQQRYTHTKTESSGTFVQPPSVPQQPENSNFDHEYFSDMIQDIADPNLAQHLFDTDQILVKQFINTKVVTNCY